MKGKDPGDSRSILAAALEKSGWGELDPEASGKFLAFVEELSGWGKRVHLVGKGSLGANLEKQILDSILLLSAASRFISTRENAARNAVISGRIADIGSGAGFPGIVWSILLPKASIVLFERREKQQAFLDRTISLLALSGTRVVGEDAARFSESGGFDIATSKAAGRMAEMAPIAGRLLREGGIYVTIKGRSWSRELEAAAGMDLRLLEATPLPLDRGQAIILGKCLPE